MRTLSPSMPERRAGDAEQQADQREGGDHAQPHEQRAGTVPLQAATHHQRQQREDAGVERG
jgi:hypothetical protein